jgi:hypothetical protein
MLTMSSGEDPTVNRERLMLLAFSESIWVPTDVLPKVPVAAWAEEALNINGAARAATPTVTLSNVFALTGASPRGVGVAVPGKR